MIHITWLFLLFNIKVYFKLKWRNVKFSNYSWIYVLVYFWLALLYWLYIEWNIFRINGMNLKCVSILFLGAEIDACDKNGNTSLHIAARYGHELLINTLLEQGADPMRYAGSGFKMACFILRSLFIYLETQKV